jgi:carbon-monoxide dehydrogenase large subunit
MNAPLAADDLDLMKFGNGEAGCAGSLPSVNAISDALGGKHINMPATPERVWQALPS